jgi:hypothetical protein
MTILLEETFNIPPEKFNLVVESVIEEERKKNIRALLFSLRVEAEPLFREIDIPVTLPRKPGFVFALEPDEKRNRYAIFLEGEKIGAFEINLLTTRVDVWIEPAAKNIQDAVYIMKNLANGIRNMLGKSDETLAVKDRPSDNASWDEWFTYYGKGGDITLKEIGIIKGISHGLTRKKHQLFNAEYPELKRYGTKKGTKKEQ